MSRLLEKPPVNSIGDTDAVYVDTVGGGVKKLEWKKLLDLLFGFINPIKASVESSATAAATSEANAAASEAGASASEQSALLAASSASNSASTATAKAAEATSARDNAVSARTSSEAAASTSVAKAEVAANAEIAATTQASIATTKAADAEAARAAAVTAKTASETAAGTATTKASEATAARDAAVSAKTSSETAAGTATTKAAEAAESAAAAASTELGSVRADLNSVANSRAPLQGLVMGGTAQLSGLNLAFGTSDLSLSILHTRQLGSGNQVLFGGTSSGSPLLYIASATNKVVWTASGGTTILTSNTVLVAGITYHIVVTRSGNTHSLYINGVVDTSATSADSFTAPLTLIGGNNGSYLNGAAYQPIPFNRALSASEVAALYRDGRPAASDVGGAGLLANQAFTNYHYDTFSSASASGFTAIEAGAQSCQATSAVGSGAYTSPVGTRFRVSFNATLTSGSVPKVMLGVANVGAGSSAMNVANGANTFELTQTVASTATNYLQVYFQTATDTAYSISGFTITRLGLLCYPDPQQMGYGTVWYDVSGNGAHITLPASGVSWALPWSGTLPGPLSVEIPVVWKPTVRIAESAAGSAHPAVELYRTTGAGTNYTGVRLVNDTGTLVIQTAPGAAIGSHTWTNRTTLDASGNLLTTGTFTAQGTGVHQFGGTLFVTGTDSKGSLVVRDNGLTSVGGSFTLLTNAGADTWRWGLRDSSGSLGANGELIFSRLDGSWASPVKFAKEGDVELTTASKGVILKSPNGTRYRITVTDAGVVQATAA